MAMGCIASLNHHFQISHYAGPNVFIKLTLVMQHVKPWVPIKHFAVWQVDGYVLGMLSSLIIKNHPKPLS